jgi:hypothetical protein
MRIRQALKRMLSKARLALWGRRLGRGFEAEDDFVGARKVQFVARGPLDIAGVSLQGFDLGFLLFLKRILLGDLAIKSHNLLLHGMPSMQQRHEEEDDAEPDDRHEDDKSERL